MERKIYVQGINPRLVKLFFVANNRLVDVQEWPILEEYHRQVVRCVLLDYGMLREARVPWNAILNERARWSTRATIAFNFWPNDDEALLRCPLFDEKTLTLVKSPESGAEKGESSDSSTGGDFEVEDGHI